MGPIRRAVIMFRFVFAFAVFCGFSTAKEWHVAPDGTAGGDGSRERPWSLEAALKPDGRIQPMDTIWVRKGVYNGAFVGRAWRAWWTAGEVPI